MSRKPRMWEGPPVLVLRRFVITVIVGAATFAPGFIAEWGVYACLLIFMLSRPQRLTRSEFAALALVVWAWLSTSWATYPAVSTAALHALLRMVIVFLAIRHAIVERRDLRAVVLGYLVGCLAAVLVAMSSEQGQVDRLTIEGLNQNYLAYTLATGAAMTLLWWDMSEKSLRQRITLIAYALLMLVGVFLTGTRGALIGMALVLFWGVFQRFAPRAGLRVMVGVVALVAYLIASGAVDAALIKLEGGIRADQTLGGRLLMWPIARTLWRESFWRGIGVGGFRGTSFGIPAHNLVLEAGVGLGVVGVLLFVVLLWSALAGEGRTLPAARRSLLIGAFLAASAPAYLSGAFEYIAPSWVTLAIFSRASVLALPHLATDRLRPDSKEADRERFAVVRNDR